MSSRVTENGDDDKYPPGEAVFDGLRCHRGATLEKRSRSRQGPFSVRFRFRWGAKLAYRKNATCFGPGMSIPSPFSAARRWAENCHWEPTSSQVVPPARRR